MNLPKNCWNRIASLVSALPFMNFLNTGVQEIQHPLKISMDENKIELALFEGNRNLGSSFGLSTWNQPCTLDIFPIDRRATLTPDQSEKSLSEPVENDSTELSADQINHNIGALLITAFTSANPDPYILSAERTGIRLFQQDIDVG